jgi:hypothetical protein
MSVAYERTVDGGLVLKFNESELCTVPPEGTFAFLVEILDYSRDVIHRHGNESEVLGQFKRMRSKPPFDNVPDGVFKVLSFPMPQVTDAMVNEVNRRIARGRGDSLLEERLAYFGPPEPVEAYSAS